MRITESSSAMVPNIWHISESKLIQLYAESPELFLRNYVGPENGFSFEVILSFLMIYIRKSNKTQHNRDTSSSPNHHT